MKSLEKLELIDTYIIEVQKTDLKSETIVIVSDNAAKMPNFGTVKAIPKIISKQARDNNEAVIDSVKVEDVVLFSVKVSYDFLNPVDGNDNYKYLIVPVQYILGIYK